MAASSGLHADVSDPRLYREDSWRGHFARLRHDDPVHRHADSPYGPYWSVSRYADIMRVELDHATFSSASALGGIQIADQPQGEELPNFIRMDPPRHTAQRRTVAPIVAPSNLANMEGLIRERTAIVLDGLPRNAPFDWVDRVSTELTALMLATLFDFPWEDRSRLTYWSDATTALPGEGLVDSEEHRMQIMGECAAYMTRLWNERVNAEPRSDLISMMAHDERTRNMTPEEFLGNVLLLIVGGNDTTRNSMTGGLLALNENPGQYAKLCANPALVTSMVPEIIRWQTPLSHMRRTATQDTVLGGKNIRKGDKVVMWYVSGNRDEEAIENPKDFIIDRARPRQHLSFGFGIHRCVGNRLAEMQLRVLWEEILKRWPKPGQLKVIGEPVRVLSPFVRGYASMRVRIDV